MEDGTKAQLRVQQARRELGVTIAKQMTKREDEQIARLAQGVGPQLAEWHATLESEGAWEPPLTLSEAHRARPPLQS